MTKQPYPFADGAPPHLQVRVNASRPHVICDLTSLHPHVHRREQQLKRSRVNACCLLALSKKWKRIIPRVPNSLSPPVGSTSLDDRYFPNPKVRKPPNQHYLSRWSLQQWIPMVRLFWVSTLSSPRSYFFLNSI